MMTQTTDTTDSDWLLF